ncbi:hypothetical protein [secondary endosymbiont of Heteropsylla cubana]|nr:hypothetical protein [secondary endosymbiont of Heteropsylla cubana]
MVLVTILSYAGFVSKFGLIIILVFIVTLILVIGFILLFSV